MTQYLGGAGELSNNPTAAPSMGIKEGVPGVLDAAGSATTGPVRLFDSFGGTLAGTLASQTAAWGQARAWLVASGGGVILFGPGTYQHMPAIDLPPYSVLRGQGFMPSELRADASIANHFIQSHKSVSGTGSDPNGVGCIIEDIALNCFDMPGWGTNAYDAIHFDRNPTFGTDPTIGSGSIVEPNQTVRHVLIRNPPRDGINAAAMGGHLYVDVRTIGTGRYGFLPTFDSWMFACSTASSLNHGIHIQVGPARLVECVAYNSGNSAANHNQGHGFYIDGGAGIADSVTLVECEAQDNFGVGFYITTCPFAAPALIGCLADSNSAGSVGAHAGFTILNSPYTTIIGGRSVERKADGTNSWQQNAVYIQNSPYSTIDIRHKAQDSGLGAATIGAPFQSVDTSSVGCDVSINGLKGIQTPAYAASYTPDFYLGGTVEMTLTGNITVNAPTNGPYLMGTRAMLILKQDGTGTHTITWNGAYVNTALINTNTTANAYTVARLVWDGTNWVCI